MNSFTLHLLDAARSESFAGVTSFIGTDGSGSFGLLAGHERTLAVLGTGLSRFRQGDGSWRYIAAPGAVVRFAANELTFSTRRYLLGDDATAIAQELQEELGAEAQIHRAIEQLRGMERDMLKRLWELQRGGGGLAYGRD